MARNVLEMKWGVGKWKIGPRIVTRIITPQLDKPEEPPPPPPMDTSPAAPNSQVVQATRPIGYDPAHAPHSPDACTHFSSKPPRFALPADDFGDREHQRHVDPGGSNFEPPGRCKACIRAGLGTGHFPSSPTCPTPHPIPPTPQGREHALLLSPSPVTLFLIVKDTRSLYCK